jgi:hypothetical protein
MLRLCFNALNVTLHAKERHDANYCSRVAGSLRTTEMTLILLTGAGFTRNWGGWLANEAFEYVLGREEVCNELRERLWKDKLDGQGFEDTLAKLQLNKQQGDTRAREMVQEFMMALGPCSAR